MVLTIQREFPLDIFAEESTNIKQEDVGLYCLPRGKEQGTEKTMLIIIP